MHTAGAFRIGRLRSIGSVEGNLGNHPWPLALERPFAAGTYL